jgi:hypothetical protein
MTNVLIKRRNMDLGTYTERTLSENEDGLPQTTEKKPGIDACFSTLRRN